MILIDTHVTDLAAGYEAICEFVATLESTWLPGFDRSYQRRQEEYRRAIQKHEERGLFLRTLLKTPKPPNRPPPRFKEEVTARLHDAWTDSFRAARPLINDTFLNLLRETFNDSFYAVTHLQLQPNLTAPVVVLGPPGIMLIVEAQNGRSSQQPQPPPKQILQQSAVAIRELLRPSDYPDTPIHAGSTEYWQEYLPEIAVQNILDPQNVFALTDTLLAHHQELSHARTFSALATAENLTKREKDNLLRMAATL